MSDNVRMATVVELLDDGRVMVIPDGNGVGSEIPALTSCCYQPRVGDRAKLVRIGGRFVVEYAVGRYRE